MPIHQLFPIHKTTYFGERGPTGVGLINPHNGIVLLFFGTKAVQARTWIFLSWLQLALFETFVLSGFVGFNRVRPIDASSIVWSEWLESFDG